MGGSISCKCSDDNFNDKDFTDFHKVDCTCNVNNVKNQNNTGLRKKIIHLIYDDDNEIEDNEFNNNELILVSPRNNNIHMPFEELEKLQSQQNNPITSKRGNVTFSKNKQTTEKHTRECVTENIEEITIRDIKDFTAIKDIDNINNVKSFNFMTDFDQAHNVLSANQDEELSYTFISEEHNANLSKVRRLDNRIKLDNVSNKDSCSVNIKRHDNNNNILTNTSYASSFDIRGNNHNNKLLKSLQSNSTAKSPSKDLIVPFRKKDSKICKALYGINPTELLINENKILSLDESNVIYDCEMSKINLFKNEHKAAVKYCQINKNYFKYFKSIYSSTVWLDRPLMRLPIANIEKIELKKNNIQKLKQNFHIKVIIQIYIQFSKRFPFNDLYELLYVTDEETNETCSILEFGLEDEETAKSFVKILTFLSNMISRRVIY